MWRIAKILCLLIYLIGVLTPLFQRMIQEINKNRPRRKKTTYSKKTTKEYEEEKTDTKKDSLRGRLVILPLPFYGTTTGLGMTIKLLIQIWEQLPILIPLLLARLEKQFAIFNTIGQKKAFYSERSFLESCFRRYEF